MPQERISEVNSGATLGSREDSTREDEVVELIVPVFRKPIVEAVQLVPRKPVKTWKKTVPQSRKEMVEAMQFIPQELGQNRTTQIVAHSQEEIVKAGHFTTQELVKNRTEPKNRPVTPSRYRSRRKFRTWRSSLPRARTYEVVRLVPQETVQQKAVEHIRNALSFNTFGWNCRVCPSGAFGLAGTRPRGLSGRLL